MSQVFISYARANERSATQVAERLKSAGFDVWWDDELPAHRAYGEVIDEKLRTAKAVVALWSDDAIRSQWVRSEADYARKNGTLVQAQLDGTEPPIPFDQMQCANLKGWRGNESHRGWQKLLRSVAALARAEPSLEAAPTKPRPSRFFEVARKPRLVAAAAALLIAIAAGLFLLLRPPPQDQEIDLAVLPFRNLSPGDENLVAGIWDDTRQALSRNPHLKVLGRQSSEAIAEDGADPRKLRAGLGIDYLLEGSVRRNGPRIRVSVTLVNASDGVEVWGETFDRRLDDVFQLQTEIAREIEGRLRGRLASGGGIRAENIATSGNVYALYSEGRANLRKRDQESVARAKSQLEKAVRLDPNYAPAWAALSTATQLHWDWSIPPHQVRETAIAQAKRALALAPNLAAAHTALAGALDLRGSVAKAALERAIDLDPSEAQSIMWLGIIHEDENRLGRALELYDRAVNIDPLWRPAVANKIELVAELGRYDSAEAEIARLQQVGADRFLLSIARMELEEARGNPSEGARVALEYRRASSVDLPLGWAPLLQLGYHHEAARLLGLPDWIAQMWRNRTPPKEELAAKFQHRYDIWLQGRGTMPAVAGRALLNNGRGAELVEYFNRAFQSPDEFAAALPNRDYVLEVAPLVAIAFQQQGDSRTASKLLRVAHEILEESATNGPLSASDKVYLARLRALEGRRGEAVRLIAEALEANWLPDELAVPTDLAQDPAFAGLKNLAAFQAQRQRVLAKLARERAELGPVRL